jgi:Protein of unknown function (DUF3732)
MQLVAVALYGHHGQRREIRFEPGALNVLTGESKTGKSALLEIIEFCLGRSTVTLPQGPAFESVSWYGLLLDIAGQRAFVGRPAPEAGRGSSTRAMLAIGGELELPDHDALEVNADADGVRAELGRMLGIEENEQVPVLGALGATTDATLAQAALLCFQRQDEIANRRQLFHRQGDEWVAQALLHTLPYFLGAVDPEHVRLRGRLARARRELRRAERELRRAEGARDEIDLQTAALLEQAVATGLVSSPGDDDASALELLAGAVETGAEPALPEDDGGQRQRELLEERRTVRDELMAVDEHLALLRDAGIEAGSYAGEIGEQAARLRSIGVLPTNPEGEGHSCPVCSSDLEHEDATVSDIRALTSDLDRRLAGLDAVEPRRQEAEKELEERASALRTRLRGVNSALDELARTQAAVRSYRELAEQRAYVQGRIAQHLEVTRQSEPEELAGLRSERDRWTNIIREVEARLDPEEERERVFSQLNVVGRSLTDFARRLGLEHSEDSVRIDLAKLTVVADTQELGAVPLERMGSAENWVGYHLVAHLALHKWFTERGRPVPRFVIFDQPSQPYYPQDVADAEQADVADADRAAVARMFELMRDVADGLDGFQVIVCDHANLPDDWFQDAVVENWRGGTKLVPTDWFES